MFVRRITRRRVVSIIGSCLVISLLSLYACQTVDIDGPEQSIIGYEKAFPNLKFRRPLYLGVAPGSTDLYVLEQNGVIYRFANDPGTETKTKFLDISSQVSRRFNEEGLLGLAFPSDYVASGHFFVRYSSKIEDHYEFLSRFTRGADGLGDPDSELVILKQFQPWRNHNGGGIEFGPDGHLYVGFGDGGSAGDPKKAGQDRSTWLGTILRIDVSASTAETPYSVPADNPFVAVDGVLPEIWAYGLRNPWRFSFDRFTEKLWCGDVGQNAWEEISIIERGGNYGWNTFEAHDKFRRGVALVGNKHIAPVFAYEPAGRGRGKRASVTGGYVYRGSKFPEIQGSYIFGDYEKPRMWLLRPSRGADTGYESIVLPKGPRALASFGEDHNGELYLVSLDGSIFTLTREATEESLPWPKKLSELGVFQSPIADLKAVPGVVGFDVNSPLWSDGAEKERFIVLPEGQKIRFSEESDWEYPVGVRLVKNFKIQKSEGWRHVETRVIEKLKDGWAAASYVWDEDQTEAILTPDGALIRYAGAEGGRAWTVPSQDDCAVCHTAVSGFLLAADRTEQMHSGGQLRALASEGIFANPPAETAALPALAEPLDKERSLDDRARAYLDANCAGCHQPDGPGNAAIDLRFSTPLVKSGMLEAANQGDFGIESAKLIVPGNPEQSLLLHRMKLRGEQGAMPPLGSDHVDPDGTQLLHEWIRTLEAGENL